MHEPSSRELRSFGLLFAAGFFFIGLWPMLFKAQRLRVWAIVLGVILAAAGILVPRALRPVRRIWIAFGDVLGEVNSTIILGTVYYVMLTPVRLVMKTAGHDPMNRGLDRSRNTYRVVRKPRPASHMKNQF
jgi:hypothetical protein